MRFLGEIKKTPCVDMFAYHRSAKDDNRFHLMSDFEIDNCFDVMAVVAGKFGNDFCSGQDPLAVEEGGEIEVKAEIEISFSLLERLENDGETAKEHLIVIRKELGKC